MVFTIYIPPNLSPKQMFLWQRFVEVVSRKLLLFFSMHGFLGERNLQGTSPKRFQRAQFATLLYGNMPTVDGRRGKLKKGNDQWLVQCVWLNCVPVPIL